MSKKNSNSIHLLALALKHKGQWEEIYKDICRKVDVPEEELELARNYQGKYITILDSDYPESLKKTFKPPFVIFYEGKIDLLNKRNIVAVTTSRKSSKDTISFMENMLNNSDNELVYITDTRTPNTINFDLDEHRIIVVVGSGIDQAQIGFIPDLVISEYPNDYECQDCMASVMSAKRIIASLCHKLVIGEIPNQSGNLMLVSQVLEEGKPILVLPMNTWESQTRKLANNKIIYEGATPFLYVEDLSNS